MEGAKSSVGYIFNILLSRCTKATKSSLDADYKAVLDALLSDLLTVLGQPEWPSAELYLFLFSKAMVSDFSAVKRVLFLFYISNTDLRFVGEILGRH